jgi:hypothetical protein
MKHLYTVEAMLAHEDSVDGDEDGTTDARGEDGISSDVGSHAR